MDLLDKLSTTLNKYAYNYNFINIELLSKSDKAVYFNISIGYDNNNIKSKKYKKFTVPYNRKKEIDKNSLNNLKYIKKDEVINLNITKINPCNKNINQHILEDEKDKVGDVNVTQEPEDDKNSNDLEINERITNNDIINNSKKIDLNLKNVDKKYIINDHDFTDIDGLINKEIDNTDCNNCIYMDNNILYLNNKLQDLYLNTLKEYDDILDNTYHVNMNLEKLIEMQNLKDKNIKIDIGNIIQNKKKLNSEDIEAINKLLLENSHEMPHVSQLFRYKIVDPLIQYMGIMKQKYNEFIQLIN